jgi:hypothetical protein
MSAYAPADFEDSEEVRPNDTYFDFAGSLNSSAPITNLAQNILQRHLHEVRESTTGQATFMTQQQWRKKLRDFLMTQHNDIFEFAAKPLEKHPVLGPVETLLRKFGRGNFQPTHQSLREVALDSSGVDIVAHLNFSLSQFEHSIKGFHDMTKHFMELYRKSAEEIIRVNQDLQLKLDTFDSIQKKIRGIAELQVNEFSEPLHAATENYLRKLFQDNKIEETYKELIEAYRKFFLYRDLVHIRQYPDTALSEPLCSICFNDPIQYVLTPCGHTFCVNCIKKQMTQCYVCRQTVRERVRLFIG